VLFGSLLKLTSEVAGPRTLIPRVGIGRLVIEFERSRLRLAKNIDEIDVATDIKVAASVLNFVNDGGLKVSTFRVFEASPQPHHLHGRKRDSRFKNWDGRSLGLFAHIKERDFLAYVLSPRDAYGGGAPTAFITNFQRKSRSKVLLQFRAFDPLGLNVRIDRQGQSILRGLGGARSSIRGLLRSTRSLPLFHQKLIGDIALLIQDRCLHALDAADVSINLERKRQHDESKNRDDQRQRVEDVLPLSVLLAFGCIIFAIGFYFMRKSAQTGDQGSERAAFLVFSGGYVLSVIVFIGACAFRIVVILSLLKIPSEVD
jgi:hypothetical protein